MKTMYKGTYFSVTETQIGKQKTKLYTIINNQNFQIIGKIKWYVGWRKYCFFPEFNTVWDYNCLNELSYILNSINIEYKAKRGNKDE